MYIKRIEQETDSCQEFLLNNQSAIALGTFDGLHKGHMTLVRNTTKYAKENSLKSCVFTFASNVGETPYITSNEQRANLLQRENVDMFVMRVFTNEFKGLSPKQFFDEYIIKKLNAKVVTVGFNYHFGHMGEGDKQTLQKLCDESGVKLFVIPPILYAGEPISSTRIRNAVEKGDLKATKNMLGREFSITGQVVHGDHVGRTLGFPTANFEVDKSRVMPPNGVYATKTDINGRIYPSITNYGGKPTIKEGMDLIETHILNFNGDLYGKTIEIRFIKKLRDINAFLTREELSAQLCLDKHTAKELLDKPKLLC